MELLVSAGARLGSRDVILLLELRELLDQPGDTNN